MTTNRIVIVLSPIFVGLAGWLVAWIAQHFPGHPHLDAGEVTAIFIAGAAFAAGKVALWLRGWQKHEARKTPIATWAGTGGVTWSFPAGTSVTAPAQPPAAEKPKPAPRSRPGAKKAAAK